MAGGTSGRRCASRSNFCASAVLGRHLTRCWRSRAMALSIPLFRIFITCSFNVAIMTHRWHWWKIRKCPSFSPTRRHRVGTGNGVKKKRRINPGPVLAAGTKWLFGATRVTFLAGGRAERIWATFGNIRSKAPNGN